MLDKLNDAISKLQSVINDKNNSSSVNNEETIPVSIFSNDSGSDEIQSFLNKKDLGLSSLLSIGEDTENVFEDQYEKIKNAINDVSEENTRSENYGGHGMLTMESKPQVQEEEKPNPVYTTSLNSLNEVMDKLQDNQKNSLKESISEFEKNNLNIDDARFDIQSNGNVMVVFPNDNAVYEIDTKGNLSKLDSSLNQNDDGSTEQTYTYNDEDGNTYTRTINYNEDGDITGSSINVKDSQGHETIVENYDENGELSSSKYASGFLFSDEPMSVTETTYKDGKKTYEKVTGLSGSSIEEKLYDDNGIVSHSTKTEFSMDGNTQSIYECNYENGVITSRTYNEYYEGGDILKNTKEERYENGDLCYSNNCLYDESGKPVQAIEKRLENNQTTYYKVSGYNQDGNLSSQEEKFYDIDGNRIGSVKTSYDENGNKFITTVDEHNSIIENKEIYKDEQGNTTEVVTSFDESGKIVKTVSSYDQDGNLNMSLTTSVGGIDRETFNSMPAEQQNAINNILQNEDISNAVFDINENGEVIITFPNNENNTIKIDENGNQSELQTVSHQNDDGSYTKTYMETDINGNSYTRTIEFNPNESIKSLKYEDNNGEISTEFSKFTGYCNEYTERNDDSFVVHSSPDEALNTGDICKLDNGNVGIRLEDGSIQELNISEETFNRIFPPDSALVFNQGNAGDCYLVSSLYSLLSNPETKAIVLSCFTENEDGSVTVKLPNGNVSFTLNPNETTGDYVDATTLVNGCEGVKMLEHLCGMEMVNIRTAEIMSDDSLTEEQKIEKIKSMYGDINNDADEYKARGNGGTSNEIYNMFGLDSGTCTFLDPEKLQDTKPYDGFEEMIQELLLNPENWDDYVFGAGSLPDMAAEEYNPLIPGQHAYSIKPYMTDSGEVRFIVTNPWDTSTHFELTYDELKESFASLFFAKIK